MHGKCRALVNVHACHHGARHPALFQLPRQRIEVRLQGPAVGAPRRVEQHKGPARNNAGEGLGRKLDDCRGASRPLGGVQRWQQRGAAQEATPREQASPSCAVRCPALDLLRAALRCGPRVRTARGVRTHEHGGRCRYAFGGGNTSFRHASTSSHSSSSSAAAAAPASAAAGAPASAVACCFRAAAMDAR